MVAVDVVVPIFISVISIAFAIFFGIATYRRNNRKDIQDDTTERATMNAMVMTKLENISDDIKEIRRDNKELKSEVQDLRDRILILEQKAGA